MYNRGMKETKRMIVSADRDGRITDIEGDVQMLGYEPDELIGRDIDVIIPKRYKERHHSAFDTYLATGKKHVMGSWVEVEALHKDGRIVPVLLVVTEKSGQLRGMVEER